MKKILSFLAFTAACLMTSCYNQEPHDDHIDRFGIIQGTVTDTENNLLEHIRITVSANNDSNSETYYTSSEGKFRCEMPIEMENGQIVLNIIIEDIDEEQNGGKFETKEDVITIFEEDNMKYPVIIDIPTYRLTRATASENIPQS